MSRAFSAWAWASRSFSVSSALLRIHQIPPSSESSSSPRAAADDEQLLPASRAATLGTEQVDAPTRREAAEREAGRGREVRVDVLDAILREPDVTDLEVLARRRRLDRQADVLAQLLREPGRERRAAGQRDPQQPRRARLRAVVVERSADLLDQVRERTRHRGAGALGDRAPGAWLVWRLSASAWSNGISRSRAIASVSEPAAEPEHAHEPGQAGFVDDHDGHAAADAHDRFGAAAVLRDPPPDRPDERERDEVDGRDGEAGRAHRADEVRDRLPVRRGQEDPLHRRRRRAVCGRFPGAGSCSRTWKSRTASSSGIGMSSWAWKRSAPARSDSDMTGRSTRAHEHRAGWRRRLAPRPCGG